jgi:hypothetical protein
VQDNEIILLGIDIEGLDAQVILETDFASLRIRLLSIEHIHLKENRSLVEKHLEDCGFEYIGVGLDPKGFDSLYRNKSRNEQDCSQ